MIDLTQLEDFRQSVIATDLEGNVNYWNKESENLFGYKFSEVKGRKGFELLHSSAELFKSEYEKHLTKGLPGAAESRLKTKSGEIITCYVITSPLYDDRKVLTGRIAFMAQKSDSTLTDDMVFFLNKASEELSSTLDYQKTLTNLSKLIVPRLADWFSIDVAGDDGYMKSVLVAHKDPEKVEWAKQIRKDYPTKVDQETGTAKVLRTGKPELYPYIPDEVLEQSAKDEKHLKMLRNVGFRSVMIVPMKTGGRVLGTITFITTEESAKKYGDEDLTLAEDFARRVALTLENVELYQEAQQEIKIRKEIEKAIKYNEQRFKTIIEALPQMAFTANSEGRANFYNQRWYDFTGLSLYEQKPEMWKQVVHPKDIKGFNSKWEESIETGVLFEQEIRFRNIRTDSFIWHLVRAVPVKDNEGKIMLWVGTCTDINEQKLLNAKKDEFLNIASHELKTPLATSKAYVQLIQKEIERMENEKLTKYSSKANQYLNVLNNLILDLLDISKIESGKIQYKKEWFDMNGLVRECIEHTLYENQDASITCEGTITKQVYGDIGRLEQVINNLISNAVKYSGEEKIVKISLQNTEDELQIKVEDKGVGISEENQKRIFDRYYRIKETHTASDGMGLGLYISSEIVHRHEGEINVESAPGEGSTFILKLPIPKKL